MRSPTQQQLRPDQVAGLVLAATGVDVIRSAELGGGGFAAVWRVDLAEPVDVLDLPDGPAGVGSATTLVLKAGPPSGTPLLTYEAGMIPAEAEYLRLVAVGAPAVPVPRVVRQGRGGGVEGDWVLTTFLPGTPLPDLPAGVGGRVRHDVGAALHAVHEITGDRFGYDGPRPHGTTWRAAFTAILASLMDDAGRWALPPAHLPARRVEAALDRHGAVLDEATRPALLHFDLWDGNVLASPARSGDAAGEHRMTGLVDGERYLFGDPLVDLVSPALFRRIEDEPEHPVLAGYAEASGAPLVLDDGARTRLALYRVWLHVLMTVEMPSRGMTGPDADRRRELVTRLLDEDLTRLGV
ncbi:aminoglycoside phosphotransferase family protein [Antribacter sp. KLBMP9083]|uniref:Aminoglycoside phosphotransferase family protein n=1 Tax=Antribacter soli TaxID=2910976 RepID=A0AA41QGR2_9MICO|nr:aminoglycoside phosphotransferase family protein [Antribacter soli]MCF4123175.1 aminoglycoside phosphotransferase family protein [Antribacter soli]